MSHYFYLFFGISMYVIGINATYALPLVFFLSQWKRKEEAKRKALHSSAKYKM